MSLRLIDEYDPEDWDVYQSTGPMRVSRHYVCTGCDGARCHLVVETADDGKEHLPRVCQYDETIMMPCPFSRNAIFETAADPKEVGWADTEYGARGERDKKDVEHLNKVLSEHE